MFLVQVIFFLLKDCCLLLLQQRLRTWQVPLLWKMTRLLPLPQRLCTWIVLLLGKSRSLLPRRRGCALKWCPCFGPGTRWNWLPQCADWARLNENSPMSVVGGEATLSVEDLPKPLNPGKVAAPESSQKQRAHVHWLSSFTMHLA